MNAPYVELPRVAFRVGVTGAACLEQSQENRIRDAVVEVLETVRDEVCRQARDDAARRVYTLDKPLLRLVSPLADGADRLVAEVARCRGFELEAPLPFNQEAYEARFANVSPEAHLASVEAFRKLLGKARPRVLTLDGNSHNDIDRPLSYEAVGRLVVRNCDLLIAIWDDEKTPLGRGGTADTVHYALRAGVPVWWIHATRDVPPRWLENILDLPRWGKPREHERPSEIRLVAYIGTAIAPPTPPADSHQGIWERLMATARRAFGIQADPLLAYLEETGVPHRKYWNTHRAALGVIREWGGRRHARQRARHGAGPENEASHGVSALPVPGAVTKTRWDWDGLLVRWVRDVFSRDKTDEEPSPAGALSVIYQRRYRTSYFVVFICGALALIFAVIGLAFEYTEKVMTILELAVLIIILGLALANQLLRWQDRYISYRMLRELLRSAAYPRRLGWSLPASRVSNLARGSRLDWVAWFSAAITRSCPLASGTIDKTALADIRKSIVECLIDHQLGFHEKRARECHGASQILGLFGIWLFGMTLALVAVRVVLEFAHMGHDFMRWASLLCAVLPAAAAAAFGIRAYEELEILADQSDQMCDALRRARKRINRIRIDQPLASQLLGAEAIDVATIMLSEVAGWAQLFRMKAVEP